MRLIRARASGRHGPAYCPQTAGFQPAYALLFSTDARAIQRPWIGVRLKRAGSPRSAFTILEIMLAIMIFAMVLSAIYATWMGILKGTKAGERAAAEVQRSRIAMRALEDAFNTAVMYVENNKYYYFIAESSGDMAGVSMVSRLPSSFPGVGRYGDQVVRRVSFGTQAGKDGQTELVMTQFPMLLDTNNSSVPPYSLVLARDVSLFNLEFFDMRQNDWVTEWINTNQLPRLVRISLGLGKVKGKSEPEDLVSRVVALPSISVAGVQAAPAPGMPPGGMPPGAVPPGGFPPGSYPPGSYPPGGYPGGSYPPGSLPPGSYPPGSYPPGGYKPGFGPGQRR